jgi:predicted NAD/FAD-binding protein
MRIAVVGSGISGASAAWLLSKNHDVTLLEADARAGGHTHTVTMDVNGEAVPVDTGFICFNSATYPNLIALFDHLDVPVHETSMSFSASLGGGACEYSGGTYFGLWAQLSNLIRPSHWRMVFDILRFFREAPAQCPQLPDDLTLLEYLRAQNYSDAFIKRHLMPMAAAIWSGQTTDMTAYPAKAFIRFFANHGLLQVEGRPKWGTVCGGARAYYERMLADGNVTLRTGAAAQRIERDADGVTIFINGAAERFDHVVIASHAKEALAMLAEPTVQEQALFGTFGYAKNHAVLHRDASLMPQRKRAWASWNYIEPHADSGDAAVTYWMNCLQNLPTKENIFVTLNPPEDHQTHNVAGEFFYEHPVFNSAALAAQKQLWTLQGQQNTWFCGAHFGAGFHEDGLQSGLAVAEQLGGLRRPWRVANESGRVHVRPVPTPVPIQVPTPAPPPLAQAAE